MKKIAVLLTFLTIISSVSIPNFALTSSSYTDDSVIISGSYYDTGTFETGISSYIDNSTITAPISYDTIETESSYSYIEENYDYDEDVNVSSKDQQSYTSSSYTVGAQNCNNQYSVVVKTIENYLPIVTYACPISGSSKVYAYKDSSLTKQQSSYYIDSFSDQIVITDISSDGQAVCVTYPSSSGSYRSKWFKSEDILGIQNITIKECKTQTGLTTYRLSSSSKTKSYGSIAEGEDVVLLGQHKINNTNCFVILYSISKKTINNIKNVGSKLALTITSPLGNSSIDNTTINYPNSNNSSSAFRNPMDNMYCTWKTKDNYSWSGRNYSNSRPNRPDHCGIDVYGTDGIVYAFCSGTVVACSSSNKGANGRYVIIEHTISGKTCYSFYAHLKSVNVSKGQEVNIGKKIGIAGGSGYGKNNFYGTHLHFAIVDTLWSSGDYYGYVSTFNNSINSVKYSNVTYYNPIYVIQNGCLPQ